MTRVKGFVDDSRTEFMQMDVTEADKERKLESKTNKTIYKKKSQTKNKLTEKSMQFARITLLV